MVMSAKILLESGDQHCPEVPSAESATRRLFVCVLVFRIAHADPIGKDFVFQTPSLLTFRLALTVSWRCGGDETPLAVIARVRDLKTPELHTSTAASSQ